MNIVTGYTGTPHITSNEAQALNQGIVGKSNYVLDVGNMFGAILSDVNTVTIRDGEGLLQGVQFRIAPGETDTVTIENGTSGYNRIDLICARYTKDAITGVEDVSLVVIQGTPTSSTPTDPSYNTGNVLEGDSPVDFPLHRVTLTGLTPAVTTMFNSRIQYKNTNVTVTLEETKPGSYSGSATASLELEPGVYIIGVNGQATGAALTSGSIKATAQGDYASGSAVADNYNITLFETDFISVSSKITATATLTLNGSASGTAAANLTFRACRI